MKILVIGGAGYIGSHVIEHIRKNHEVAVFDNLSSGFMENLPSDILFINGDILDSKSLDSALSKGFDCIMHFAALKNAGESMHEPQKYYQNNVIGTFNILNAMAVHGVRNIVFSSSAAVYGSPKHLPMDESHPLEPENFYGFTKLECERILEWYSRIHKINFAALRYFNAAGYMPGKCMEKNPGNLLPIIMEVASGRRDHMNIYGDTYDTVDGTGVRDYIHVLDLADAHLKAMEYISGKNKNLTINLSTQKGHSVLELVHKCEHITGRKINYRIVEKRSGDPSIVVASSRLAHEILGWEPVNSSVDNILASMWQIYKKIK